MRDVFGRLEQREKNCVVSKLLFTCYVTISVSFKAPTLANWKVNHFVQFSEQYLPTNYQLMHMTMLQLKAQRIQLFDVALLCDCGIISWYLGNARLCFHYVVF